MSKSSFKVVEDTNKGDFYSGISHANPTHPDAKSTKSMYRIIYKIVEKDI